MPFCRSYILWFLSCCVQTSSSSFTHRHFLSFFLHTLTLSKRQFLNHAADYKPWTQPDHNIYHRMRRLKLGIMFYVLNLISNQLQPRPHYCAEVCAASTHTHTLTHAHKTQTAADRTDPGLDSILFNTVSGFKKPVWGSIRCRSKVCGDIFSTLRSQRGNNRFQSAARTQETCKAGFISICSYFFFFFSWGGTVCHRPGSLSIWKCLSSIV